LEAQVHSDTRIRPLIEAFDLAINAVHNTTVDPVSFLHQQILSNAELIEGKRQSETEVQIARDLGSSVLNYMKHGTKIFPYLNAKRDAKASQIAFNELKQIASPEAIQLADYLETKW